MTRGTELLVLLLGCFITLSAGSSFVITNSQFHKDGQKFQILSGSFHYFRVHPDYWNSTFHNMRYIGLNTAQTYVPWNIHEPSPGNYVWDGFADIVNYLKLAQANDMLVVLRLGPYICGEWEYGGFPFWLMQLYPNIKPRTSDPNYLKLADTWWSQLLPKLKPYLYSNGGPVILAQIENEYGDFGSDKSYLMHLRDTVISYFGNNTVIIHSTDPANAGTLSHTYIPGVFQTVDFSDGHDINASFVAQHTYDKNTPEMNSEYYPGWFVLWNVPTISKSEPVRSPAVTFNEGYSQMLALGASINIYMFRGSTNWGFMNGASGSDTSYSPIITSYDYTAPLSEAGDPTDDYPTLRQLISKYQPVPNWPAPTPSPKGAYGTITLGQQVSLFSILSAPFSTSTSGNIPQTFEQLGLAYGYVLYQTSIAGKGSQTLSIPSFHDRATIFVDNNYAGVLQRALNSSLKIPEGSSLDILVENQGRISHGGDVTDWKGIQGSVTLGGSPLTNWKMNLLPFLDVSQLTFASGTKKAGPTLFQGTLTIPSTPRDTYVNLPGWTHGIVLVNGFNLGRYWSVGPQHTLYVPAPILKQGANNIVVFETQSTTTLDIVFQTTPII